MFRLVHTGGPLADTGDPLFDTGSHLPNAGGPFRALKEVPWLIYGGP